MDRPRLLLVPTLTEIEWEIRTLLDEWAEVASYDAPGVGDEPPAGAYGAEAVAERGLDEIERRGWDRCFVIADEFGVSAAVHLGVTAPHVVQGMALGHARLSNRVEGERAPVNREVRSACISLIQRDPRTYVRQIFRMTGGEHMEGGYKEKMVQEYHRRVPNELMLRAWEVLPEEGDQIGEALSGFDFPLLLAGPQGCLLFTDDGFNQATAAMPHVRSMSFDEKPSTSPEFAQALEAFCTQAVTAPA
jgi:hypothetical protein